jgi:hypothetical protein
MCPAINVACMADPPSLLAQTFPVEFKAQRGRINAAAHRRIAETRSQTGQSAT